MAMGRMATGPHGNGTHDDGACGAGDVRFGDGVAVFCI